MSDKPTRTARGFAARGVVERGSRTAPTAVGRSPLDRLSAPAPGATRTPELDATSSAADDDMSSSSWGIDTTPGWLAPEVERRRPLDGRERLRANGFDDDHREDFDLDLDRDVDSDEDEYRPRRRFAVAPAGAIALIAVGVIACVIAGFGLLRSDDVVPTVAFPASAGPSVSIPSVAAVPSAGAPAMPSAAAPSAASAQIVVSVVGLVRKPGLVRLAPRSRVADALSGAGGAREGADTTSLNLAQVLGDGDQVLVGYASKDGNASLRSAVVASGAGRSDSSSPPSAGDTSETGSGAGDSGASNSAGGKVDLNTASAEQLDALPGVGPVTAKAIIDWRSQHGKFTSVDQLGEVDGIGPARLAKLRDLVTAG
ncbi:ComEA family DNA-binding protein [Gordonia sp. w5E2]|uniref:ComEA family DNA-binding protein n=1 Tax=Gordonia TaxID=2053 RepID=UPI000AC9A8C7|nr:MULTISPECIES: ComEA family DNA-binding protein [Gordonia]